MSAALPIGAGLGEIARAVRRRWWLPLFGAAAAAASSIALVAAQEPVYEATATMEVAVGSAPGAAGTAAGQRAVAEQLQLLRSPAVRRAAQELLGLQSLPFQVRAVQRGQSAIVTATVQAADPDTARHVADALALGAVEIGRRRVVAPLTEERSAAVAEVDASVARVASIDAELLGSGGADREALDGERASLLARLAVLGARVAEIDVDISLAGAGVAIVEPAVPTTGPVAPTPGRTVGLAAVGGAVVGVGVSMVRRRRRRVERIAAEWQHTLGVPVLAMFEPAGPGQGVPGEVLAAARQLRVMCRLAGDGEPPRSVLLCAVRSSAEVASIGLHHAVACAHGGMASVLVDADLGASSVSKRVWPVGVDGESVIGLADVLAGGSPSAATQRVSDHLWVVPAGATGGDDVATAELLVGDRCGAVLAAWQSRADALTVVGPPLDGGGAALALAARLDRTVLVVHDRDDPEVVADGVRQLRAAGATVAGVALVVQGSAESVHSVLS